MAGPFEQAFVVGIPSAVALGGLSLVLKTVSDRRGIVWVRAVVTGHEESTDSDGTVYRTTFEYEADGRTWRTIDDFAFGWRAHKVGDAVWVGYPPDDPAAGRPRRMWPAAMGAALFVGGLVVLAVAWARI